MSLKPADVANVALLARLKITPAELETLTGQLNSIVDYVAQLQELDTNGIEPLAHGCEVSNVFRTDSCDPALDREKALANAPDRSSVGFLVPAVLE
jgi:aspartyl-tRNA(Asn)/glutamyl-tRNA(Gln) amidotransferase subunit C